MWIDLLFLLDFGLGLAGLGATYIYCFAFLTSWFISEAFGNRAGYLLLAFSFGAADISEYDFGRVLGRTVLSIFSHSSFSS